MTGASNPGGNASCIGHWQSMCTCYVWVVLKYVWLNFVLFKLSWNWDCIMDEDIVKTPSWKEQGIYQIHAKISIIEIVLFMLYPKKL